MGRSRAYYSDEQGKQRKRQINQRRCRLAVRPTDTNSGATPGASPPPRPRKSTVQVRSTKPSPVMVQHVRMVLRLIEGRPISRRQVLLMLAKNLRQHTLTRRKQIDHAVVWLQKQPP